MFTVILQKARKYRLWSRLKRLEAPLDQFYFAYGANVDTSRFDKNFMHSSCLGVARLLDYRIDFTLPCQFHKMGYSSVSPAPGEEVWGVLYRMDALSLDLLDILEWVNYGYYKRVKARVQRRDSTERHDSWVYVAPSPQEGLIPSSEYLGVMVKNSRAAKHPVEYVERLEATAHQPMSSFEYNLAFRIAKPMSRRPLVGPLRPVYRCHDSLRQKIIQWLP